MVDLSRITQIELEDFGWFENNDRVLNELKQILREADQFSALLFRSMTGGRVTMKGIEKVISILPPYCDRLTIAVIRRNQIRTSFKQNSNLRSIQMLSRTLQNFSEESSQVYMEISFIDSFLMQWKELLMLELVNNTDEISSKHISLIQVRFIQIVADGSGQDNVLNRLYCSRQEGEIVVGENDRKSVNRHFFYNL